MTYSKHSSRSTTEVEARLREATARHKFGILNVLNLEQMLKSKGFDLGRECVVFDVCNPQAASKALTSEMKISTVLPCRISVYGDGEGCTLATVKPTDLLRSTGASGVEKLATEIEREIVAIIDEAA